MIIALSILLFVACIGLYALSKDAKKSRQFKDEFKKLWLEESGKSSALRNEKYHEWERANVAEGRVIKLKTELAERPLPVQNADENTETGNFIKRQAMRRATPETYRNVFDLDVNGQRVIEHLQLTFANKSTYVRGGQDAERESCFRAGQATVVGFILNQINKANNPECKDEVND